MTNKRQILLFWLFAFLAAVFFFLDLLSGPAAISPAGVFDILINGGDNTPASVIIFDFRMPKALSAVLIGAGLSVAGLLMQSLFRNPLAGPYVLGVSSGASLAVAVLVMAGGIGITALTASSWMQALFAVTGSVAVLVVVLLISVRVRDSVSLLIVGIMIAGITSSVVSVLQFFTSPDLLQHFMVWTFGSLSGIDYSQLSVLAPVVITGIAIAFLLQKPLNSILLGDNYASLLGVSIRRLRVWLIVSTGLIAGTITAFAGPVVFVGVAVPHLTRSVFRTGDHRILVPASVLTGSVFMLACDIASQIPGFSTALPVNAVTSIVGAPVIIWIIMKNRRLRTANF